MAAYASKQRREINTGTGLLPDLVYLCWEFLQSYPELTVMTVGRTMAWLDRETLHLGHCMQYDLKTQCMVCKETIHTAFVPKTSEEARQALEVAEIKIATNMIACQSCFTKCNSRGDYIMNYCDRCNYICVFLKGREMPDTPCLTGRTYHRFTTCFIWY